MVWSERGEDSTFYCKIYEYYSFPNARVYSLDLIYIKMLTIEHTVFNISALFDNKMRKVIIKW